MLSGSCSLRSPDGQLATPRLDLGRIGIDLAHLGLFTRQDGLKSFDLCRFDADFDIESLEALHAAITLPGPLGEILKWVQDFAALPAGDHTRLVVYHDILVVRRAIVGRL